MKTILIVCLAATFVLFISGCAYHASGSHITQGATEDPCEARMTQLVAALARGQTSPAVVDQINVELAALGCRRLIAPMPRPVATAPPQPTPTPSPAPTLTPSPTPSEEKAGEPE